MTDSARPTGTIKSVYGGLKNESGEEAAVAARKFMSNRENELRLLFWETTAGCNLECVHCRRLDVAAELMKDDLSTAEAKKLMNEVAEVSKCIFVLSGGEPLFRPDIFELARYGADIGLTMALATNGTLVTKEIARKIEESGIQRVSISLDGATAKTHDSFRKLVGSFDAAVQGFRNLREVGMSMQINSTIAKHNVDEVKDLYQFAIEIGADALHIFMLVPVGCGVEIADDQMLDPEKYEEVLNWFYDISKENKIQTKATCAPHYFRIMRQRAKEEGIPVTPKSHGMSAMTKGCLAGSAICFVSHKGEVFPCGYLPVEAGNIRRQTFGDVWRGSKVFADLRDPDLLLGKCGACEYKKVCEGCRARAFYNTGNYLDEEPYCIYVPKQMQQGTKTGAPSEPEKERK